MMFLIFFFFLPACCMRALECLAGLAWFWPYLPLRTTLDGMPEIRGLERDVAGTAVTCHSTRLTACLPAVCSSCGHRVSPDYLW